MNKKALVKYKAQGWGLILTPIPSFNALATPTTTVLTLLTWGRQNTYISMHITKSMTKGI